MAEDRTDPADQIPEADLLEQRTALVPQSLTDADTTPADFSAAGDADEADRLEQNTPVLADDEDDYPHEATGAEWS